MDILQAALIFLMLILSILLSITGFYVFLILKDLKKALDRLNKILDAGEGIAQNTEKTVEAAASVATALGVGVKALAKQAFKKESRPTLPVKRFFKKSR